MNISIEELNKHIIPRQKSNGHTTQYVSDIFISVTPATRKKTATVRFNYHHDIFKKFEYITFYKVNNSLYFKLSHIDADGTAYKISRKKTTLSTQVSGATADALKEFEGSYFIKQNDYTNNREPIFYITGGQNR